MIVDVTQECVSAAPRIDAVTHPHPSTLNHRQDLVKVNGRVLDPPKLAYGEPKALDPGPSGAWNLRTVGGAMMGWSCLWL